IRHIEAGRFFDDFIADDPLDGNGWYWRLEALPEGPEARYLYHLLATHEFQEGLKNYRDLNYLYENLNAWQRNIDVYDAMLGTREKAYAARMPNIDAALARADLEGLVDRKLELDSTLNTIEKSNDWPALASASQAEMWRRIAAIEATPALQSDIPEAVAARDRIRLLKGVMQWDLQRDFKERLWRSRRDLRQTAEALLATQRSRRQIDQSMRLEPQRFDEIGARVDGLAPRLESTRMRVEDALARQRAALQSIAVGELQAQKQRLDIYTVQARFALAAIYDIAAMAPGKEQ
ncbi:MAG: hypothetical protein KJO46_10185, partial [Gammaproteobacteria bacterium]|nr:hypothetical protein [Gammaproteobacteria bacterium]